MAKEGTRVHAIVCAYPALGHINPLLRLSTLLVQEGIRVTFVSTQFYCDRLTGQQGKREAPNSVTAASGLERALAGDQVGEGEGEGSRQEKQGKGTKSSKEDVIATKEGQRSLYEVEEEVKATKEGISFEGLPDGLPADFDRISPSTELSRAVNQLHTAFEKLMRRVLHSASPAPSLLITDAFLPWTHDVALALVIPRVIFWPQSVAVFTIFEHTDRILNSGFDPFLDDLDAVPAQVVDFLPGLPALPTSYLPYRIKPVEGQDRRFLLQETLTKQSKQCRQASCILFHSFGRLESLPAKVLQSSIKIPMKLVGPLVSLPHMEPEFIHAVEVEDVLEWLDTKADSSVLYICLGSVVSWTKSQVEEVGLGLMAKKQAFLWVMRPWQMTQVLPHGLLKLGKIVKFAPQVRVLGHPAIGGFLSHCGWNSTLESVSMGVPILAWPHFLDQFTNCWYVVHVWKVGVELGLLRRGGIEEAIVDRDQFARAVTLLMEAEAGQMMRLRASNLKISVQDGLHHQSGRRNLGVILSELIAERILT